MNVMALRSGFRSALRVMSKHSPAIAAGIGVVSIVSTAILAVRATPKTHEIVVEGKEKLEKMAPDDPNRSDERRKIAVALVKGYWPAAVSGVVGIASIIFSHRVNVKRNMALASAYALTLSEYKAFREKAKEMKYLTPEKEHKIEDEMAKDKLTAMVNTPPCNQPTPGDELFYDWWSGRKYYSTVEKHDRARNNFNFNMLHNTISLELNEYYDELGLDATGSGELEFYAEEGPIDLVYGSVFVPADGRSYTTVQFDRRPT